MKKFLLYGLCCILLVLSASCSQEQNEEAAKIMELSNGATLDMTGPYYILTLPATRTAEKIYIPIEPTYYYTKEHVWVDPSTIRYGWHKIGMAAGFWYWDSEVVFVEVNSVGEELDKGYPFCSIEFLMAVSDFYMPAKGTVMESNEALADKPSLLNEDPYENWIILAVLYKFYPEDDKDLMNAIEYANYLSSLAAR